MKRFLMFMIFAMVFMAASAQAASGKMYFSGNAAIVIPMDVDGDPGEEISFDPGWNVNLAVGYDLGTYRVEGEIGYTMFDLDEFTDPSGTFPVNGDVSALTFMANGYYDHDMGSAFSPYVGLGLGLVYSEVEIVFPAPFGTFTDDEVDAGYQVMLGVNYEISPTTILTAGYRFFSIIESDPVMTHNFSIGARFMF